MTLPFLAKFTDIALLLLRLMLGVIFFTSGWKHTSNPEARSKSIEMSKGFTVFWGMLECFGALGVRLLGALMLLGGTFFLGKVMLYRR